MIQEVESRWSIYCDQDKAFYAYMMWKKEGTFAFYSWAVNCSIDELKAEHLMYKFLKLDFAGAV